MIDEYYSGTRDITCEIFADFADDCSFGINGIACRVIFAEDLSINRDTSFGCRGT
jgi:hypothetical protein